MLLPLNLDEYFVDEESIAVSLVTMPQSSRVFGTELDAPQPDRFVADRDSALGHEIFDVTSTQIEAVIEPDCILDDLRGRNGDVCTSMKFYSLCVVTQVRLSCQYPSRK